MGYHFFLPTSLNKVKPIVFSLNTVKNHPAVLSYYTGCQSLNRLAFRWNPILYKTIKTKIMKIVVIGGTGLIGTQVVNNLRQQGHQVIAASPATGIDTITGEGLAEAMNNTDVVIDLA